MFGSFGSDLLNSSTQLIRGLGCAVVAASVAHAMSHDHDAIAKVIEITCGTFNVLIKAACSALTKCAFLFKAPFHDQAACFLGGQDGS